MTNKFRQVLKNVIDPELHVNIVDLGLIYSVEENDGLVEVTMTLTTPGCPLSPVFEAWITDELKKVKGVKKVRVDLTFEPPWDPSKMSAETRSALGF